mmetsp:Transcript_52612/g.125677  ORF Transcript_52612/g.125677 Transcript_52612/m.125677 type:complete len:249 (-) Transcript_52612:805-1551(-)
MKQLLLSHLCTGGTARGGLNGVHHHQHLLRTRSLRSISQPSSLHDAPKWSVALFYSWSRLLPCCIHVQNFDGVAHLVEWRAPRCHEVQNEREGVHIHLGRVRLVSCHLRCHVRPAADAASHSVSLFLRLLSAHGAFIPFLLSNHATDAKVSYLRCKRFAQEDVERLQVPMNDWRIQVVQERQGSENCETPFLHSQNRRAPYVILHLSLMQIVVFEIPTRHELGYEHDLLLRLPSAHLYICEASTKEHH